MVRLVPMNESEFHAYRKDAIVQSACDHIKAGKWMPGEALRLAEQEDQRLLPEGLASPNHYLFTIEDEWSGIKVGALWFAVRDGGTGPEVFVYDVRIIEEFRRRHYGTAAFLALESHVRKLGLTTISLHVFGHNLAARTMYEKLGYVTTNVLMSKTLSRSGGSG
jgi:RimJ/RimL family protein N-acetyltransferase